MIYLSYGDGKTTVGLDRLIKEGISCAFLIELLALNGAKLFHPITHFSIIKI